MSQLTESSYKQTLLRWKCWRDVVLQDALRQSHRIWSIVLCSYVNYKERFIYFFTRLPVWYSLDLRRIHVIALSVRCLELKILEVLSCLPVAKFSLYRTYTVKCWTQWPKSREIPFPNCFIKADPKVCCRRRRRRWRWWHSGWCPRPPLAIRIDPQFIALLQLPRISDVYLRNFRLSRALQHARNWKSLQVLAYIYSAS